MNEQTPLDKPSQVRLRMREIAEKMKAEQSTCTRVFEWMHENNVKVHVDRLQGLFELIYKEKERSRKEGAEEAQGKIVRLKSDIAHAIGYCRGLGHPETYLEKQYPELTPPKDV